MGSEEGSCSQSTTETSPYFVSNKNCGHPQSGLPKFYLGVGQKNYSHFELVAAPLDTPIRMRSLSRKTHISPSVHGFEGARFQGVKSAPAVSRQHIQMWDCPTLEHRTSLHTESSSKPSLSLNLASVRLLSNNLFVLVLSASH